MDTPILLTGTASKQENSQHIENLKNAINPTELIDLLSAFHPMTTE